MVLSPGLSQFRHTWNVQPFRLFHGDKFLGFQVIEQAGTIRQNRLCCFTFRGIQRATRVFNTIFVAIAARKMITGIPSLKTVCRLHINAN
jgi:hypothetical protein